jgi:hypothetical protein
VRPHQGADQSVVHVLVTGPLCGGVRRRPFAPGCGEGPGYVLEEFLLEGQATAYRLADGTGYDDAGRWDAVPSRSAPYQTRILVVRPVAADDFSGTVLVNWQNVTRGFETGAPPPDLAVLGLAWVGVSAQRVGHVGFPTAESVALKGWDPERYGTLDHPGDDFSFDIFTQAARVVGPHRYMDPVDVDPMGGLAVTRVLATGTSQSALRLRSYIDAVHPIARHFDGFFLTLDVGSGAVLDTSEVPPQAPLTIPSVPVKIREDLLVPVMVVNSESEVLRLYAMRQPDTDVFRQWEIAGSAHISSAPAEVAELDRQLEEMGIDPASGMATRRDDTNVVSHAPVVRAAMRHMLGWLEGPPPPHQPLIEIAQDDPPTICRDQYGQARGGVRLPDVEVPLAQHCGLRPDESDILARISGSSVVFSEDQLRSMYSGPSDYLDRYGQAFDAAVAEGILVEEERPEMMSAAHAAAARAFA